MFNSARTSSFASIMTLTTSSESPRGSDSRGRTLGTPPLNASTRLHGTLEGKISFHSALQSSNLHAIPFNPEGQIRLHWPEESIGAGSCYTRKAQQDLIEPSGRARHLRCCFEPGRRTGTPHPREPSNLVNVSSCAC